MIDGAPVLFDAIEFNDSFSCIDVFYDLAFMLMDLDWHGLRGHANTLLNRYAELTGDQGGLAALPLFLSCRAAIRAHVALSTLQSAPAGAIEATAPARLLQAAGAYLDPPRPVLIAIGGISGTGKSTLARALAPAIGAAPGALVLRSDVVRKSLMGVSETDRLDADAYGPEPTAAVYRQLCESAARALRAGHSVIIDAVCGEGWQQAQIAAVAHATSVQFRGIWLEAPLRILEERVRQRYADVSDATVEVLQKQVASVSAPSQWQPVKTEGPPGEVLADVRRVIGMAANPAH
jgi:predicted kinase